MNETLNLQSRIFESLISRRELLSYKKQVKSQYTVQIFRNHSFELIEHTLGMYLDYAKIGISFSYSGYDDSLSFTELDPTANLVLIWLDSTRYISNINDFLDERVKALREKYTGPILIIPYKTHYSTTEKGVVVWNLDEVENLLKEQFSDLQTQVSSGTPLSGKALLYISRHLGLKLLPALLHTPIKAIVVDLDNTLYKGILGEDGIKGVELTSGHFELQKKLKELADQGFFLCAASKNEITDVKELFLNRNDFPLRLDDFSTIEASWNSKDKMISNIASYLNIHTDSMLFIDDNIGELTTVFNMHPEINIIHAKEDAHQTYIVLCEYPGLLKLQTNIDDQKRKKDIQAKELREINREKMSPEEYIRSLSIKLEFESNNYQRADRVYELANKTNQFIFSYKRYSRQDIEDLYSSPKYAIITVSLSDKLSDSGMIGVCVARKEDGYIVIEECFVSCRALGRGIDDMIVLGAFQLASRQLDNSKLIVEFKKGPRNMPAEQFINQHLEEYLLEAKEFKYNFPKDLVQLIGF